MLSVELPRRSAIAVGFATALTLAAGAALAQPASTERPKPPTVPLEDLPPPPPMITAEPEPQVTTRAEPGETVQEYRIHNKLYMMKVTPRHGKPYVLMDQKGDGTFTRMDQTVQGDLSVPQWVLMEF